MRLPTKRGVSYRRGTMFAACCVTRGMRADAHPFGWQLLPTRRLRARRSALVRQAAPGA